MSTHRALRSRINKLLLAPAVIMCLLLSLCFIVITGQFIHQQQLQRTSFVATVFDGIQDTRLVDQSLLNQISMSLLAVDGFRTVVLINHEGNILWARGLPLGQDKLRRVVQAPELQTSMCEMRRCYTRVPIKRGVKVILSNRNIGNTGHSILVVTDNYHLNILNYDALIAVIGTLALCLAVAVFFAQQFRDEITRPLVIIQSGVQKYSQGKFDSPISPKEGRYYSKLINSINELAAKLKGAQDNLNYSIEQTTAELRETLETVEIQNIELDIARKGAIQASKVKSEFLANTSHEIRTPLNGILGFSELLKKTELNPLQEDYLDTIYESAKGLLTIINDILDFSRLETGKLTLEYKPVRLRQVLEEALRLQAPAAHEKKLRLLTIVDHDIPEHLLGDPLRLKQVLTNLLSNAIKFTNVGHILISVSKEDRADNQITLQFRITDSGIGLNQEQQEKLFDAFTQLDASDSRTHGGTGLGLAIAKGLVDRMHGEIGVESEPGKGATFWFTSILGRNPNAANSAGYLMGTLRNTRTLVYDCSLMSRTEITHYLRGWGASVTEIAVFEDIENKTEEACRSGQIHLAVLDAQSDDNSFDKGRLRKIVDCLNQDYSIPVVILASPSLERLITPEMTGTHATIMQRPIFCNRLHQVVCEQLGIIIPRSDRDSPEALVESLQEDIRVLAVDDNPANLRLVSELLKEMHVKVVTVDNGADAIRLSQTSHFDLILMDIQMPGMDGLEATKRLRSSESREERTPVVALTAHAANEQKSRFLLAGMDDYLTKPVSENELRHIIDRWVTRNPFTQRTPPQLTAPPAELTPAPTIHINKPVDLKLSLHLAKNKPDLAEEMLSMLLVSLPDTAAAIEQAMTDSNKLNLLEVVHKLHGGCCYCGVPRLKHLSEELDQQLQNAVEQGTPVEPLMPKLRELIVAIQELITWSEGIDLKELFAVDPG